MQSNSATLPAVCIETAVCMKTKEELYHKICFTPRLPRVVLKANSHSGQPDQREQDARTSCDQPSELKSSREAWNSTVDNRIPVIPLSTIEQQDTNRKDKVKKLIEQFESHPYKECFLQDLRQTQKIDKFSEESQVLIADMNNTKSSTRTTTTSHQFLSMFFFFKKKTVAVPNMDLLNDNECVARLKKCCKTLVNKSMEDNHPYMRDGIMTTYIEILCHPSGGPRSTSCYMTELLWRIIYTSGQELREFKTRSIGF